MYLLDTNVFSQAHRGNLGIKGKFEEVGIEEICLCAPVVNELYFGALNHPTKSTKLQEHYQKIFSQILILDYDFEAA